LEIEANVADAPEQKFLLPAGRGAAFFSKKGLASLQDCVRPA
jgi:hypothetical protein